MNGIQAALEARLTADPETRYTPNGKLVMQLAAQVEGDHLRLVLGHALAEGSEGVGAHGTSSTAAAGADASATAASASTAAPMAAGICSSGRMDPACSAAACGIP